jgi:hypothetical protein
MNGHLAPNRMWVPTASVSRIGGRPTSHATPSESSAIEFVSAIALVTTGMVTGAALITAVPPTVAVPVATVLGSGLIATVLVAAGDGWLARSRTVLPLVRLLPLQARGLWQRNPPR